MTYVTLFIEILEQDKTHQKKKSNLKMYVSFIQRMFTCTSWFCIYLCLVFFNHSQVTQRLMLKVKSCFCNDNEVKIYNYIWPVWEFYLNIINDKILWLQLMHSCQMYDLWCEWYDICVVSTQLITLITYMYYKPNFKNTSSV